MHEKDPTLMSKTKQKFRKLVVTDQRYGIFYVEIVVLYECYGGSLAFSNIFLYKTKIKYQTDLNYPVLCILNQLVLQLLQTNSDRFFTFCEHSTRCWKMFPCYGFCSKLKFHFQKPVTLNDL